MEKIERELTFAKQKYYDSGPRAQQLLAWRLQRQNNKASILKIKDRTGNMLIKKIRNSKRIC